MPILVPNKQPTIELDYRLALVGEAPGTDEELMREPFVGASGRLLKALCAQSSIMPSACLVANIVQHRPPNNDITKFDPRGQEFAHGKFALKTDISAFDPHCILLLGATPLKASGISHSISDYRGSVFQCMDTDSPFFGRKCISTYHPAAVLRNYEWAPLMAFDLQRAREEANSPNLAIPQRTLLTNLSADEIILRLTSIRPGELVSIDIEGGIPKEYGGGVTCVGIATSASEGFIVNHNDFSDSERTRICRSLGDLLGNPSIPKVLQNSLYDNFVLSWLWRCPIRNVVHDTMLSGWEIYPELPKGLGTQASIWTREPFYKFERKIQDQETHYRYCIKDACVTYEIAERHRDVLAAQPDAAAHFAFNVQLLPALLYMELKGIRYDREKATSRCEEIKIKQLELQSRINAAAGGPLNVNSPKQMTDTLYKKLGFEPQYKKEHGRKTNSLTADVEALLSLARQYNESIIFDILRWRALDGQRKQLEISSDNDGRVRCSYNIVGTETGRLNSSESPTGTGTNLQTITAKHRDLYTADPGYYFFQCDLSGADGWTVAAHCARLGDSTMLDDYLAGLKPALIIAMMKHFGSHVSRLSRADLLDMQNSRRKEIPKWLYDACKAVQHGCYTGDHELLTTRGWLPIGMIRESDAIACYDPATGQTFFDNPQRTVEFNYTGELHTFEGTAISLQVTHDHKMLYKNGGGRMVECLAKDLIKLNHANLPITSQYVGGEEYVPYAKLIAAYQSDGAVTQEGYVTFHFAKVRKMQRLAQLLLELGVPCTTSENTDGTFILTITEERHTSRITEWGKYASEKMLCWDSESLKTYLDEYPWWDGHFGKTSTTIFAVSKEHIDWFATFLNITGTGYTYQGEYISGFGSKVHRLNINKRSYAGLDVLKTKAVTAVKDVPVFCVTVRSGFVLVRRDGKISISGNSNYGMGKNTMSTNILKQGWKKGEDITYVSPKDCEALQLLYFSRYIGIRQWHNWVKRELEGKKQLSCASGHTRTFFGRPNDLETFKSALSHEPQANTTYATNLAAHRLWHDEENWNEAGLIIQPLHQVHDAICGQFPIELETWSRAKINSYFNNKLSIAGMELVIPWEGKFGASWGELTQDL